MKLFTAKPGRTPVLFLLLVIVALQWSFTSAVTGENPTAAYYPALKGRAIDTSITPAASTAVATSNKPASTRSNRTTTKQALAANLDKETISFGSPTGGPDSESGTTGTSKTKAAVKNSTKNSNTSGTTGAKAVDAGNTKNIHSTGKEAIEPKSSGTTNTTGTADKKNSGTTGTKAIEAVSTKNTHASNREVTDTKSNTTTKIKSTGAVNTENTAKKTVTGNTKVSGNTTAKAPASDKTTNTAVAKTTTLTGVWASKLLVYDSLHLKEAGLSKKVFTMALKGMSKLVSARHMKDNLLAIVDYSQPSNKKRLYVIDLNSRQLLYNTYVAHGMKTGKAVAQSFSNKPASCKSSLGFYVTGNAYQGSNGYSLKLEGVEKGINDRALDRGIVIHGADYVCEGLIESQGFIGRSWGCPAVALEISQELIDLLKGGSCLFIYHPSQVYKAKSTLIQ